jgi:phage head maturation protease
VATDDIGMLYSVEIPETTLGRDLQVLISRGDIFGSSFAFTVAGKDGESWTEEDGQAVRYVHEVDGIYDVSPVLSPA